MLSSEDRTALHDLYTRYCLAVDIGDVDAWVDIFTPDCLFCPQAPATGEAPVYRGRDQVRGFAERTIAERPTLPVRHAQHWITNLVFEGDAEQAKGFCYYKRFAEERSTGQFRVASFGYYQDRLRKIDGRWYVSERRQTKGHPLPGSLAALFG